MLNLSLKELKLIARSRHIKSYKTMSKERLLSALNKSKSAESKKNLHNAGIKQIKDRFLKPKIKEIEENLLELEESLSKLKNIMIIMIPNKKE